jgi:hypothetical protein
MVRVSVPDISRKVDLPIFVLTAVEVHEAGVTKSAVHGVAEEEEEIFSAEVLGGTDE